MPFLDLSHTIEHGMTTHPGLPGPLICDFLSREASRGRYAPGVEFQIGRIDMVANTGTYVDSPFHRYAHGKDLSALPLESLAGLEAVLVEGDGSGGVGPEAFFSRDVRGKAVLVRTGWDARWGTPAYLAGNPFLTAEAAAYLVAQGAALVGIDSVNIDDLRDLSRPVHSTLLGAEIPIVEHLCNLGRLPPEGFTFTAVPPRVAGVGTWPVRAFATL
ncbi:MAG TPA: cyclase family protein [Gemmatimonadales bacterium]|nr:cyclase family protein [Gemmatimonadales bacterium]